MNHLGHPGQPVVLSETLSSRSSGSSSAISGRLQRKISWLWKTIKVVTHLTVGGYGKRLYIYMYIYINRTSGVKLNKHNWGTTFHWLLSSAIAAWTGNNLQWPIYIFFLDIFLTKFIWAQQYRDVTLDKSTWNRTIYINFVLTHNNLYLLVSGTAHIYSWIFMNLYWDKTNRYHWNLV